MFIACKKLDFTLYMNIKEHYNNVKTPLISLQSNFKQRTFILAENCMTTPPPPHLKKTYHTNATNDLLYIYSCIKACILE